MQKSPATTHSKSHPKQTASSGDDTRLQSQIAIHGPRLAPASLVAIGVMLKQEREAAGLSQADIVVAIGRKYDQSNIARMETGYGLSVAKLRMVLTALRKAGRKIDAKDIELILQTFGCKEDDLVSQEPKEPLFTAGKAGRKVLEKVAAQTMQVEAAAVKLEKIVEAAR